jgi:anti-sigma regulatory factor (Ser/Thr protein kinase)
MEATIKNTIENSSFKELAIRMTIMSVEEEKEKEIKRQIGITDTLSNKSEASFNLSISRDSTNGENDPDSLFADLQYLNLELKNGLFSAVGGIRSFNMLKFDSIFSVELKNQGLNIPYQLQCRYKENDSLVVRSPNMDFDIKSCEIYPLGGFGSKEYSYYLYMDSPKWYIFKDMWGLITVSVLMIILLIVTYVYLIKIILRQKTIDEIKGDFVNNMTHELKTPISVTYAAVDALQNFGLGDDPVKRNEYLNISREQLMYLNRLVEQILTMSVEERKNLRLTLESINLADEFESQKNKFLLNAAKPTSFIIDINPQDLSVNADKLHFTNIIGNLIENAVKYSNDTVEIKLSAYRSGDKTIISVCDNGIGIPSNSLDKIFDKFYRVSTGNVHDIKGYGLGLSYVKTIVNKLGWDIRVESTLGKGTCFKIITG